jgi:hypothetical protein
MKLTNLFVAVEYCDRYIKCQAWPSDFIAQTDRLVFIPELMDEPERKAFSRMHRNWRLNPCMARYPLNGGRPELICERGDDKRWRWNGNDKPTQVRGRPVGMEFRFNATGAIRSYHFDENWMHDTGALQFRQNPAHNGGFTITRIKRDGDQSDLEVASSGIGGTMPARVAPDSYPCWYGGHARTTRC